MSWTFFTDFLFLNFQEGFVEDKLLALLFSRTFFSDGRTATDGRTERQLDRRTTNLSRTSVCLGIQQSHAANTLPLMKTASLALLLRLFRQSRLPAISPVFLHHGDPFLQREFSCGTCSFRE